MKEKYSREFWVASSVELFERAAWYGMFILLTRYLTDNVGFTDVEAGWLTGVFAALLYFTPTLSGAYADIIGFRKAVIVAFSLLTCGYTLLGLAHTKPATIGALTLIVLGGSFIKPTIAGTVAACSSEANRARAFSIFYMMVNIGSFSGKLVAKPLRVAYGPESVILLSAALSLAALVFVVALFRSVRSVEASRTVRQVLAGLGRVMTDGRFMALIIIVGGFWAIQGQLYATMPKYVERIVGKAASPEWYANVNPLVVVMFVVPVTRWVSSWPPVRSIGVALLLVVCSSLTMSVSPFLTPFFETHPVLGGLHPVTVTLLMGIGLQGLGECFLSPRFLEYASKQAPPGETGLYMGYSSLTSFFGNILGFGVSGYLLAWYCPDPKTLDEPTRAALAAALQNAGPLPAVYAHAHYIWYAFAALGLLAFVALLIFNRVTGGGAGQEARAE